MSAYRDRDSEKILCSRSTDSMESKITLQPCICITNSEQCSLHWALITSSRVAFWLAVRGTALPCACSACMAMGAFSWGAHYSRVEQERFSRKHKMTQVKAARRGSLIQPGHAFETEHWAGRRKDLSLAEAREGFAHKQNTRSLLITVSNQMVLVCPHVKISFFLEKARPE